MQLEYGKRYVLENGQVTGAMEAGFSQEWPFKSTVPGHNTFFTWTLDGIHGCPEYKVVSEYCETVCDKPAPVKKLKWVPGRTYKMRNGGLVFVILVDEGQSYPVTGFRLYPGEDAEQFPNTWTIHGKRHMGHVESSFDIVDYGYEVGDE
jgi:hypothetical protein